MEKEEKDRLILLLAVCKLMKIDTFPGAIHGALQDAQDEVQTFEEAITPGLPNPLQ